MSLRKLRATIRFVMSASIVAAFVILFSSTSFADPSSDTVEAEKLLPRDLGSFHQTVPVKVLDEAARKDTKPAESAFPPRYFVVTEYTGLDGEKLKVQLDSFASDSD